MQSAVFQSSGATTLHETAYQRVAKPLESVMSGWTDCNALRHLSPSWILGTLHQMADEFDVDDDES